MQVGFKKIDECATLPSYSHASDSGMDVRTVESYELKPFEHHAFRTGLAAEIPDGVELQVRPRSGLSSKGVVAMWGTVDQGYRGEIGVTLININTSPYRVMNGDRIAQLVPSVVTRCSVIQVDDLSESDRGVNGFGSTGK